MATPARAKMPLSLPPGPKGNFLLGSMLDISHDWLASYARFVKNHGDLVYFRMVHVPICLVIHPADIERVLITDSANFFKSADYRALAAVLGQGLLTSEGEFWRRQRGLIQPAFRRENILSYAPIMTAAAARMLSSWRNGEQRNIHAEFMRLTLEIVGECLFGAQVADAAERVGKAMEVVTDRFITDASVALLFPFDIPGVFAWRKRRAIRKLDQIINGVIRARRNSNGSRTDLLHLLLSARDAEGNPMREEQLRDEVMTLFLAGHETTAIALSWTCYLLAKHPDVEAKLQLELQAVLEGRAPTTGDLPRLRYTEMVLKESMRLYPAVWGFGRKAIAECELGGYRIPAGTNIFMFQFLTQRDPRFFSDPERFDPERWREDPVRAGKIPRFAYFPFGGGPRVCVGASFATMEAALLLAMVQQQFHLQLTSSLPIEPVATVTLRPKNGIPVTTHRRPPTRSL